MEQQGSSAASERDGAARSRLVESRICVHVWRSRRLVHSSTRGKAVHVCEPCLREWNREISRRPR